MSPPSARPWLGVGAALSALPAAGGCFCAALVLAVVADSDPGAVYEQHRWLGAIVAASAVCAFVAMMGWATLRHGGLPAPVLLIALALCGAPVPPPARAVPAGGRARGRRLRGPGDGRPAAPAGQPRRHAPAHRRRWPAPPSCSRSARRSASPRPARARPRERACSPTLPTPLTRSRSARNARRRGTSRGARIAPRPGRSLLRPRLPSSSSRSRRPLPSRPSSS